MHIDHLLGTGTHHEAIDDLTKFYGMNASLSHPCFSFSISKRSLSGREQLDLSRFSADAFKYHAHVSAGDDGCGHFLKSYGPNNSPSTSDATQTRKLGNRKC